MREVLLRAKVYIGVALMAFVFCVVTLIFYKQLDSNISTMERRALSLKKEGASLSSELSKAKEAFSSHEEFMLQNPELEFLHINDALRFFTEKKRLFEQTSKGYSGVEVTLGEVRDEARSGISPVGAKISFPYHYQSKLAKFVFNLEDHWFYSFKKMSYDTNKQVFEMEVDFYNMKATNE